MLKSTAIAALLGLAARATAQVSRLCPETGVCFSLNIPTNAQSGSGDIFIQMTAPTSYSWAALGQGDSMSGAQMFIMYASANGRNVTVSPRLGTGHTMPRFNANAQITLLEGSGIANGVMTANFRCSSCHSWNGGSMDFSSSTANWIYAALPGNALNTDSTSQTINEHASYGPFRWNMANAMGGTGNVNPFLASNGANTSGGPRTTSCIPRSAAADATRTGTGATATGSVWPSVMPSQFATAWPTQFPDSWSTNWPSVLPTARPTARPTKTDDSDPYENDKRSFLNVLEYRQTQNLPFCDETSNDALTIIGGGSTNKNLLMAHGILASLAFVVFFPFGAISIRVFSFPGLVAFHAVLQAVSYLLYIVGFGVGVYLANELDMMDESHPIIGIVCFVLLFFQPILGFFHHSSFKKTGTRSAWSHGHLWLGRGVISLGIVNGGLGLKLADNSNTGKIAYAVVAAFIWFIWMFAAIFGEVKRSRQPNTGGQRKLNSGNGSPRNSSNETFLMQNRQQQPTQPGNNGFYPPPQKPYV